MIKQTLFYLLNILFLFSLNTAISQSETYIPFRKGDLWGYADTNRNIVLTPAFEEAVYSQHDLFIVKRNKQQALFGKKDKMLIDFDDQTIHFRSDFIAVRKGKNILLYSLKGHSIFPNNVINARKLDFDMVPCAIVKTKTNNYGLVQLSKSLDKIDKWLLDTIYQEITDIHNPNFLKIIKADQVSKYNKDGSIEIIPEGKSVYDGEEDVFEFIDVDVDLEEEEYPRKSNNRQNAISNSLQEFLVDGRYKVIVRQRDRRNILKADTLPDLYKRVDTYYNKEYFKNPKTDAGSLKHAKWAFVTNEENKVGIMNSAGELIVPCYYDAIDPNFFPNGCKTPIFSAQKNKKWGLIDSQNQIVLDFKYEEPVENIYRKGPEVRQRRTTCFTIYSGVVTKINGKYGIVAEEGKVLLPFKYDSIKHNLEENTFSLMNGDKHGLFVNEVSTEKKGVIINKLLIEPIHHKSLKKQKSFHKYRVGVVHDEQHNFLGFLDPKGFYYFED